jgi:hypothetical protein
MYIVKEIITNKKIKYMIFYIDYYLTNKSYVINQLIRHFFYLELIRYLTAKQTIFCIENNLTVSATHM